MAGQAARVTVRCYRELGGGKRRQLGGFSAEEKEHQGEVGVFGGSMEGGSSPLCPIDPGHGHSLAGHDSNEGQSG